MPQMQRVSRSIDATFNVVSDKGGLENECGRLCIDGMDDVLSEKYGVDRNGCAFAWMHFLTSSLTEADPKK